MAAGTPQAPAVNPWIVAIAVMFATFMEVLDTTVVNVSLPHIAGSLSASGHRGHLGAHIVPGRERDHPADDRVAGKLFRTKAAADGRGRRIHHGLVPLRPGAEPGALIVFRIIQGATGGALQPLSQAVMLEAFPPRDRGKAMAFWGLGIVVAPMLGPVLGGWLTDNYSWRWVFYINIPVGLASIAHDAGCSSSIRLTSAKPSRAHRLLGHRAAHRRHRSAAGRSRSRPAGGLVLVATGSPRWP